MNFIDLRLIIATDEKGASEHRWGSKYPFATNNNELGLNNMSKLQRWILTRFKDYTSAMSV